MKKVITRLFLFLSILSFGVLDVAAENIDVSQKSSLNVTYQYENEKFYHVNISLYHLATIDQYGSYHFTDQYLDVAFDPVGMSVSDLNLKAQQIEEFILKNRIQADSLQKTDQNGVTNFSNLELGLYLVLVDSKEVGNYRYSASPALLSIPILEDESYQYDIQMNVKTKREELAQEVTPPGDDGTESVPDTIDNILFYVILLVVSLLVILGVVIYIIKRKDEKNENKK